MEKQDNEYKGIIWHCDGIIKCEEPLPGYIEKKIDADTFREIFLRDNGLEYILFTAKNLGMHFHIVTHTEKTSTCEEKANLIRFPLERVIKGIYFEDDEEEKVYAVAVPGTKHKEDIRLKIADFLELDRSEVAKNRIRLARKDSLPMFIEYGTVHPFLNERSFYSSKEKIDYILFDKRFLDKRRLEGGLDDFSFTLPLYYPFDRNHKISIQMNYNDVFIILNTQYGSKVKAIELV